MNTASHGLQRAHFLSLKWKALILSSLVLVSITGLFTLMGYLNLTHQFAAQREMMYQRRAQQAKALIEQSLEGMRLQSGLISELADMRPALRSGDPKVLERAFDSHWPVLQFQLGLDIARFYDAQNQLLAGWDYTGLAKPDPNPAPALVHEANEREEAVSTLSCEAGCTLYTAAPLLVEGQNAGVVLLGSPLTDLILNLQQLYNNEVGLIVSTLNQAEPTFDARTLSPWHADVVALTQASQNLPLLHQVAKIYPDFEQVKRIHTGFAERNYEISLIEVKDAKLSQRGFIVVIADITQPLAEIRAATRKNLVLGTSGLALSELLLLALLWTPMSRLRHTAKTLPLLGEGAFAPVRHAISAQRRRRFLHDEIDILDTTAVRLSHRLEDLEAEVTTRLGELARERDFVHNLLDTAPVIILTQNEAGSIVTINPFGEALTCYPQAGLIGRLFWDLLDTEPHENTSNLWQTVHLHPDFPGYQHSSRLKCQDGTLREVDWLHTPLNRNSEGAALILSIGLDVTERKKAEQHLTWLADHDPLTGLFNRRRFQEEITRALALTRRLEHQGALLFFDLDQFKYINDTSGHQAGDMLLKIVAESLSHVVRETDIVARLGGDEFAILIGKTNPSSVVESARRISQHLSQLTLPIGNHLHRVSASIGIALFPDHATDEANLLAAADLAMYQAKEAGRGRWHLYSPNDQTRERLHAHVFWKERVEWALANDRLVLYYQPIMNLKTGKIIHCEGLLRMLDESGSLIGPGALIEACERTGLIHALDHWVLNQGIAQLADFTAQGHDLNVALNLSGRAFEEPDLLAILQGALERHQADPKRLILEITETAAVADFAAARGIIQAIRSLGCRFALDDFGTGFSSLKYLKQLPVDFVKIDGSFIRHLTTDRDDQVMVKALADIAHSYGKLTVAEFVESSQSMTMLRDFGVDYAQGFFIGRPIPATELIQQLASTHTQPTWHAKAG